MDSNPSQTTPKNVHQRIYPHTDHVVQNGNETGNPDNPVWVVRNRGEALRNERQGRGRAVYRVWLPGEWQIAPLPEYANEEEYE